MRVPGLIAVSTFVYSLLAAPAAQAVGVGEPLGFTINIQHGATNVANRSVTIGPGMDLPDIKISDGTPESFTQIGTLPGGGPIILKVVTEDDALYRILHAYILAPISLANIDAPGPVSLFDPLKADPITVSLTNLIFTGGSFVEPRVENNNSYFVSYMRDIEGKFYHLPNANAFNSYGHGVLDIQVPGQYYLDGTANPYQFSSTIGSPASVTWANMVNPGPAGSQVHNGFFSHTPASPGYVFELGLSVAFVKAIPEPGTLSLMAMGLAIFAKRRRRASARR